MALGNGYLSSFPILLVADSAAGLADQERTVHALDGRIGASLPVGEAGDRLGESYEVGAVMLDASQPTADLESLLDRLDLAAREGRFHSIVAVTPDLVDLAAARCSHPHVEILCGATEAERIAALALAMARSGHTILGVADADRARLKQLSEEVGRIARTLAALSEPSGRAAAPRQDQAAQPAVPPSPTTIRTVIRMRRLRDQFFSPEFFADPAWDMLLDLMAARLEGQRVAVSSLCIAAAVPTTTALRWIKMLTDEGLFVRVADPKDGRRVFIDLSEAAAEAMASYFQAIARFGVG